MSGKLEYIGWQVGITYQTENREGLDKVYLKRLLSEMNDNGMNFISFMMISHWLNDPLHDGYTWPVRNPRLRCYLDEECINADPQKEFLKEIIAEANGLGFHVQLFMNGFWWNPDRVKVGYPHIQPIMSEGNKVKSSQLYYHCADNEDTWKLACDEVEDLFNYYSSFVRSYGFEMVGVGGCHCDDTMKKFNDAMAMGKIAARSNEDAVSVWSKMRAQEVLTEYTAAIKTLRPGIEVWHHGYMELGDYGGYRFSSYTYKKAGVDVAMPCVHTITDENMLQKVLESSGDFPLVLHVDTRSAPTCNYNVSSKNPAYILSMGEWILNHYRPNLKGVVFFNEVYTSPENRSVVYEVIRRWRENGLL